MLLLRALPLLKTIPMTLLITEEAVELPDEGSDEIVTRCSPRKYEIIYSNVFKYTVLHLFALYGLYVTLAKDKWLTIVFNFLVGYFSGFGITVAAHRLWSHRAFKATMPLQAVLMLLNSMAFQSTAFEWIRDHRLHHKYSDTDADPYNASRGFFFSHIGWLLVRKHPQVKKKGKTIDMSDIYSNPVLKFQQKYAVVIIGLCCYLIPTGIPIYFWNETFSNAFYTNILRHVVTLHSAFTVNSVAHLWGTKPYDKTIKPVQSWFVSLVANGEGYHNYHHVFPWDYRAAEIGNDWLNPSTRIIDMLAKVGLVYDLKTAPEKVVSARVQRTGDESKL